MGNKTVIPWQPVTHLTGAEVKLTCVRSRVQRALYSCCTASVRLTPDLKQLGVMFVVAQFI